MTDDGPRYCKLCNGYGDRTPGMERKAFQRNNVSGFCSRTLACLAAGARERHANWTTKKRQAVNTYKRKRRANFTDEQRQAENDKSVARRTQRTATVIEVLGGICVLCLEPIIQGFHAFHHLALKGLGGNIISDLIHRSVDDGGLLEELSLTVLLCGGKGSCHRKCHNRDGSLSLIGQSLRAKWGDENARAIPESRMCRQC